ncbi:DNA-formamidopyrimidine glycosylase [Oligoflexia bacterium]|nr:DNA-formamidopyrimidine glycosylase [Oligoflexia bacterium]
MPELPEVETVVNYIKPLVVGQSLERIRLDPAYPQVLATHTARTLNRKLRGCKVVDVRRRAKYIVFDLEQGFLVIHLRMTGRLQPVYDLEREGTHLRATFEFKHGNDLFFVDYRKFGRIYYYQDLTLLEERLGLEPLSRAFTAKWLMQEMQARKRMVKPFLLDQSIIAGLGNIYADETLWKAKVHPLATTNNISAAKITALHKAIKLVLRSSIKQNGTTFNSYAFGAREAGRFRNKLQVFGRTGLPCKRCRTKIEKTKVAQRGTHLCPQCQMAPK